MFSDVDIVRLHREQDIQLRYLWNQNTVMRMQQASSIIKMIWNTGGRFSNKRHLKGQRYRCKYRQHARALREAGDDTILKDKYIVNESRLMKKRSVQQKLVEFMILRLISKETIFELIDTLFLDMAGDHEEFDRIRELEEEVFNQEQASGMRSTCKTDDASRAQMDGGNESGRLGHLDDSEEDFTSEELDSSTPSGSKEGS